MRQDRSRKTRSDCRDQVQFSDLKPVIEGRLRRRVAPKPPLDSYTFNHISMQEKEQPQDTGVKRDRCVSPGFRH